MKNTTIHSLAAMALTVALAGCQNAETEPQNAKGTEQLKVNVIGVSNTRAILEGAQLPAETRFTLFPVIDGKTSEFLAVYNEGVTTVDGNIEISTGQKVPVYAFWAEGEYGYGDPEWIKIDGTANTDYLWGQSVDSDGKLAYAEIGNAKANILFEHVMARITLNFKLGVGNSNSYDFSDLTLGGTGIKCYREAYVNVVKRTFTDQNLGKKQNIPAITGKTGATLNAENQTVTVDFLVIPSQTKWAMASNKLNIFDYLPENNYQSGKQYVYDITVNQVVDLVIGDVQITPWQSTIMPEIEVEK